MSAISKLLTPASSDERLRGFDPRRDLVAVADLVELCFADTLDEGGREYLRRMRLAAGGSGGTPWAGLVAGLNGMPLTGFVWQEDGRVVGNVSLIPYYNQGRWFFLIANVAVHPDYRRRGIARRMTERAVEHARQRRVPAAWLHVRQENSGATALYQSLGFQERARRTTWVSSSTYIPPQPELGVNFTALYARDWPKQRAWLLHSYPPDLTWHMPFHLNALRPDLWGGVHRFLYDAYIVQWGAFYNDQLQASLSWQSGQGSSSHLWLAAPPALDEAVLGAFLNYVRRHLPTESPVTLDYPAEQFSQALRDVGFTEQQTLIWMELKLS